jgi:hypothetical protein
MWKISVLAVATIESLVSSHYRILGAMVFGQEGAEDLMQIISTAEMQRDVAAAAAADASMSATKASNVLVDVTTSIDNEMQNTHHGIKQFQASINW